MRRLPVSLVIGGAITALLLGAALLSRVWTPADPTAMNVLNRLKGPARPGCWVPTRSGGTCSRS